MELKRRPTALLAVYLLLTLGFYSSIWTVRRVAELNRMTLSNRISFALCFAMVFFSMAITYFIGAICLANLIGGFVGVDYVMLGGMSVILVSFITCHVKLTNHITRRVEKLLKIEEVAGYPLNPVMACVLPVTYLQNHINLGLKRREESRPANPN